MRQRLLDATRAPQRVRQAGVGFGVGGIVGDRRSEVLDRGGIVTVILLQ
jgi:hypothetical protein